MRIKTACYLLSLLIAVSTVSWLFVPRDSSPTIADIGSSGSKAQAGMSVKDLVAGLIKDNKVIIFSKSYCPFCHKAKRALAEVLDQSKIKVIELDQRDDGNAIQDELSTLTGGRSVPRVFINQKFIGGGDDVVRLKDSGELATLTKGI